MKLDSTFLIICGVLASTAIASGTASTTGPNSTRDDDVRLRRIALETAERMARDTIESLGRGRDECDRVASLAANASVLSLRADLSLALASCINEESGARPKFAACLEEIFEEFAEGLEEVGEQHDARLELCRLTGGGIYDPDLDEDEFVEGVDHLFLPFLDGATWVYEVMTAEGLEEVTVTVTGDTKEIDDIECIVVQDVVTLDGELVEDTFDWFAQHEDGTIWYMGEIAKNFEDGELVDIEGSWLAGEDGGQPGMLMMGVPTVGTTYRQELLLTEAEDAATVLATNQTVTIGLGTFTGCLKTADFSPLEPDALEYKYYAPGIGLILEEDQETGERLELVSFTPGS